MMILPRYPIFIPSKGRAKHGLTARAFADEGLPFQIVVEPQEVQAYAEVYGAEHVLSLPKDDQGLVYSRNWIKDHSLAQGAVRHWQFDDDIKSFWRLHKGRRLPCEAGLALAITEDFVDRYENVAIASLNDNKFLLATYGIQREHYPPFYLNARCYTCFLVLNQIPYRWRYRYNEDTDMSLQVLAGGWCTVLMNAFCMWSPATLSQPGGQMVSPTASYAGNGRLKMARQLERVWSGVVTTKRRFGRAQHVVKRSWQQFDTPLKRKAELPRPRDYGLALHVLDETRGNHLRHIYQPPSQKGLS